MADAKRAVLPLEQQLDEGAGGGESSVGRKEDMSEVWLLLLWVQEVGDQALQGGGLQPPNLHGVVLDTGRGELGWVRARKGGLPCAR
ncbi:unnamed protein product [Tetraodon nigroviridis]|uniref:(spotted green pufferfish) hypothetical protein n=1 Tax=Tetraodon nigroviridis TaxID=99883 RepID=Q4STV2_TETNG|nr:unnamed protein product [Tetraodon nigroviridis]